MTETREIRREIRIVGEPFDPATLGAALAGGEDVGAVVSFAGFCRSEGGTLAALELEHYPGMAEAEIGRLADEAVARWPLARLLVVHRHGLVRPGEAIVFVGTAAAHRGAAFAAAEFLMDFLKTRAPFWKKEHRVDGSDGGWVAAKDADDVAAARWAE
ncbi:molybdenum cofactor biosynthesis protein MoaE [Segnochrobactrum spirostomi]|uniref:Molybdopterin synthase catalytic subunit n=1 Tax=Segnochrobactrum spirostomi TaxID=2608987 RepID=A0A6A7Y0A8_9HYPH|nr:molybdenum cofactor biosynthesis protein MoaE [Segnochrobactrum spirostomi]MQT12500.1 molybdenum cofactor biosynthesis protein MoaE [Segnochrobactrum spirostomi]